MDQLYVGVLVKVFPKGAYVVGTPWVVEVGAIFVNVADGTITGVRVAVATGAEVGVYVEVRTTVGDLGRVGTTVGVRVTPGMTVGVLVIRGTDVGVREAVGLGSAVEVAPVPIYLIQDVPSPTRDVPHLMFI